MFFSLSDDEGLIGFIGLEGNCADRLLRSLVVLPIRRGKGYGRMLAERLEGAADGAGLGLQFLRHIERTQLLLHLLDVSGFDGERDPIEDFTTISRELGEYKAQLLERERWVVFNKIDVFGDDYVDQTDAFRTATGWSGPVFHISAATGKGCPELVNAVAAHLAAVRASAVEEASD